MSVSASPAQEPAAALPEPTQWRRVHPITPLLEGWKTLTALLAFLVWQNAHLLGDLYQAVNSSVGTRTLARVWPWVVAAVVLVLGLVSLGLWLSWRMRRFAVDRYAVYLRTGVLSKQLRTARLPRIQSVDVVHPLLGRFFGLGRLTVEVAGGGDSRVVIGFLRTRELHGLRDQILSLAAGQQLRGDSLAPGQAGPGPAGAAATAGSVASHPGQPHGTEPPPGFADALSAQPLSRGLVEDTEHDLYEVDTKVLIGSMLRSGTVLTFLVVLIVYALTAAVVLLRMGGPREARTVGVLLSVLLPVLTVPVASGGLLWSRFDKSWRFRAAATPAGIRMRYGLTAETSSTLPPGRVHGVHLQQGLLWRGPDWWRVVVSVAGRERADASGSGAESSSGNVLLPVGVRDTALRALWLVVPGLGVQDPDAFLEEALGPGPVGGAQAVGAGPGQRAVVPAAGFVGISPRGRVFSPLAWRREGIALTDTCVVLRLGRWRRRTSVVPYERIQSLRLTQGPFARCRDLVTIHLDMVDTAIDRSLSNLDRAEAAALVQAISARALRRRGEERLDRWLLRATSGGGDRPAGCPAGSADTAG